MYAALAMGEPEWYAPPRTGPIANTAENAAYQGDVGVVYGDFWIRFVARTIDWVVTTFTAVVGVLLGGAALGLLEYAGAASKEAARHAGSRIGWIFIVGIFATLAYSATAETIGGATVGKWICGLRVRRQDLASCGFGAALGRNLAFYIDSFFFGVIAAYSMSRSKRRKRVGDRWAGTVVAVEKTLPIRSLERDVVLGVAIGMALRLTIYVIAMSVLGVT